jgi:catechol 2,3-dioxygenase-like lactoylglutathione lyase family enzyme
MGVARLAHYSIRAADLDASERFYTEALGFRAGFRPPFGFPGRWLYQDTDETDYGVVHLIGAGADDYLGRRNGMGGNAGTGALDHIAFLATDWPAMRARLRRLGIPYRERSVPLLGLHQVFLEDPSGIVIELNYPAAEASSAA